MTTLALRGGRVFDPETGGDQRMDLFVADGVVASVGAPPAGFQATETVDATGLMVLPGLLDLAARLREPGETFKASIQSEARAAVAGGITTLLVPPDTRPVIDTPAVVELIHQRAVAAGGARVLCLGALTKGLKGEVLGEMDAMRKIGCVGVSNAMSPIADTEVLLRAMQYAANCGLTLHYHPMDAWLGRQGFMHEGPVSTRLGIPPIPDTAETIALARALLLVEQTGTRTHFCRLSSARSVELLAAAKRRDLPITADVGVSYLFEVDEDVGFFDSQRHVQPPFRSRRDREALRAGVAAGTIDAICSDHQPHDYDAKADVFSSTEPGITGLDTLLSLTLRLAAEGAIPLAVALRAVTLLPARIMGKPFGTLKVGAVADLCLVDLDAEWTVTAEILQSAGKNTPYLDQRLKGRVVLTLVEGKVVFRRGGP
jgi:dihydroorotase